MSIDRACSCEGAARISLELLRKELESGCGAESGYQKGCNLEHWIVEAERYLKINYYIIVGVILVGNLTNT